MILVREVGWFCRHDLNLGSLKEYIGNLEEENHGHILCDLLE